MACARPTSAHSWSTHDATHHHFRKHPPTTFESALPMMTVYPRGIKRQTNMPSSEHRGIVCVPQGSITLHHHQSSRPGRCHRHRFQASRERKQALQTTSMPAKFFSKRPSGPYSGAPESTLHLDRCFEPFLDRHHNRGAQPLCHNSLLLRCK